MKVVAPTPADIGMVRHDEVHYIGKLALCKLASITCKQASTVASKPYLRGMY